MNAPITASFRWTRDEFLRAQRLAIRHLPYGRVFRFMPVIGVLILLSGVLQFYRNSAGWPAFLFTVLFSGFFFSMPLFTRRASLKLFAQKPDRDMQVTWEIRDDGVVASTELASSRNTWAFFREQSGSERAFYFFQVPTCSIGCRCTPFITLKMWNGLPSC